MPSHPISAEARREIELAVKSGEPQLFVAKRLGLASSTVSRNVRQLIEAGRLPPSGRRPKTRLRPDQRPAAMLRMLDAVADAKIARELRVSRDVIKRWRWSLGLRGKPNGRPEFGAPVLAPKVKATIEARVRRGEAVESVISDFRPTVRALLCIRGAPLTSGLLVPGRDHGPLQVPTGIDPHALLARIRRSVPRWAAADMRAEAVSDMLLAVYDGWLAPDQIEAEAKRFLARVITKFADSYRTVAIDSGDWRFKSLV